MKPSSILSSYTHFVILPLMAYSAVAIFGLFFAAETHGRAKFDLEKVTESMTQVGPPHVSIAVHRSGSFAATVSNQGVLGNGFIRINVDPATGLSVPGVEFPQGSGIDYLFAGALWVGGIIGDDTLVSVGADGWQATMELWPDGINSNTATVGVPLICDVADQEHLAMYFDTLFEGVLADPRDGPHRPLALKITQTSRSWAEAPFDDFLILEFLIQNIGVQLIENVWVGLYMDADVLHTSGQSGFTDDIAGYIGSEGIAWIADNDGHVVPGSTWEPVDPRGVIGVKFLDFWPPPTNPQPNFNWWISNGNAPLDWGPRRKGTLDDPFRDFGGFLGTPEGDKNKYYIMRHREVDYDQLYSAVDLSSQGWLPPSVQGSDFADGFDTKFLLSQGGNSLAPGDTIRLVVALVMGADVHVNPDDFATLFDPLNPDAYHNSLDFSDLIANANAAESLYNSGYNTPVYSPPPPPELVDEFAASPVITWCFSANPFVEGYNIYLKEIPPELIFCGIAPVDTLPFAAVDKINGVPITVDSFQISGLTDGKWYQAAVAIHPHQERDPILSEPLIFHYGVPASPDVRQETILAPGSPFVSLDWFNNNSDIDHFNIYRIDDSTRDLLLVKLFDFAERRWKSSGITFNTVGCDPEFLACVSANGRSIPNRDICAYRLQPHATVPGFLNVFAESIDSAAKFHYFVTSVDNAGNESIGSRLITAYTKPSITKPLAVYLTDSVGTIRFGVWEKIYGYYQQTLAPSNPKFIIQRAPSGAPQPRPNYFETGNYDCLLIDGAVLSSNLDGKQSVNFNQWIIDYIASGGIAVYMGSGVSMGVSPPSPALARRTLLGSSVAKLLMGIDSTVLISRGSHDPRFETDTLFHYYQPIGATPGFASDFPPIEIHNEPGFYSPTYYDVGPAPFKGIMFSSHDSAEVIYTYRSGRNPVSELHGQANVLRFSIFGTSVYTFFFSPWELAPGQFGRLLTAITGDTTHQTTPEPCCELAGDANKNGKTNIADVVFLIERLFKGGPAPVCCEEGSADGNTKINIGDVTYIIAWLFNGGPDPVCGPAEMGC